MSSYERVRLLTQAELEAEILRLGEEDCASSNIDTDDEDPNYDEELLPGDANDSSSEIENNIEYVEEEDEDAVLSDENLNQENNELDAENCIQYTAKSGMIWQSKPFRSLCGRRRCENIITDKPGLTLKSDAIDSIVDVFNLFIDEDMKSIICKHTNDEAMRVYNLYNQENHGKEKQWKEMSKVELDAFIGILISAGALHCRKENTAEMWTTDESIRRSIFTASMSRNRFIQIRKYLRFDDKITRPERRKDNKLAAINELFYKLVDNCKTCFIPHETLTIDEQLVSFRGRCPFRQFIKSKPARYGIKIWALADVKTSYLYNLQVYTGKPPGGRSERLQGERVVKDLMKPLFKSGRSVTTDNFFTSAPLAEFLLTERITLLGTVRKNKADTPEHLKLSTRRAEYSSLFAFSQNLMMVSYIPKKGRMVHVLSSQHHDEQVSQEEHRKPNIILEYNTTKGGVDNADKLIREYSCARRTARWPFRLFMNMLDIACLNAFIIYTAKYPDWKKTRSNRRHIFLKTLGKDLAIPNMKERLPVVKNNPHVVRAIQACGIHLIPENAAPAPIQTGVKRGRCRLCPRLLDKKVNIRCTTCGSFICKNHRKSVVKPANYCTDHKDLEDI